MKVELTDEHASLAAEALEVVSMQRLPLSIQWDLTDMTERIAVRANTYRNARNEILKKYGKDAGNGQFSVPPDKRKEYYEELNKIGRHKEVIHIPRPIPLSQLERFGVYLTASQLKSVKGIFIVDDRPKEDGAKDETPPGDKLETAEEEKGT